MSKARGKSVCLLAAFPLTGLMLCAAEPTAEQIEFFESKVRPIFAEHCYTCHSEKAEKLKGGLRLDAPEAILKGGDTAPAIVPGDVEGSLLIKAVRYTDPDLKMPPKNKKLSAEQIASLEAWVKMGAPLPRSTASSHPPDEIAKVRARHWAFQPVKKPAMPAVKNSRWVQTPVDNFVLATLEKRNLSPAPMADRRTLIRRVSYDLTGLPPTYEEVEAFMCDQRPDSYARVVDRLLASPHYGERWARYWLDVARYADTKGYLAGGEERRYAFSYTYRDYVVRALNEDKPYNQFLIEQIAADKLQLGDDKRSLAALGFLTLGRRFLNNQNDIIDDRIDVVARGTLGLTVACARCHDHKFDPIPTKDYYALHGVFASSEEPGELPLLGPLKESADYQDYLKQKAKIEAESEEYKVKEIAQFIAELRQHVGDYLFAAHEAARLEDQSKFDTFAGERKVNPTVLRRWMTDLVTRAKKPDPIFQPWFDLAKLPEADFATNAKPLAVTWATSPSTINPAIAKALTGDALNSLKSVADTYTKLFKEIDAEWKAALEAAKKATNTAPSSLANADREALRQVLYAEGTPLVLPRAEAETILARKLGEGTAPFRNRIEALNWTHAGAPARAMALVDRSNPGNSHVLKRGNPSNPGEEVPRHFLEILSATNPPPFTNGSGRLELARAIASPDNPLTARVYVNRIWLHHFGEGLVNTPGDFGVRTEEPIYRALLDYLAATFVENGWSQKSLHRMILLSATYQQSSEAQSTEMKVDPDNRLLSHMNRQRLDFEALRDTLLDLSGKLDLKVGGLPVEIDTEPFAMRRTLYALIERQNLPAVFRTFDFANPDTSNQGRFHTTVPQQALFLMNSPFVIEQARNVAQRSEITKAASAEEKIQALYRLVLQRSPQKAELELGEKFIAAQPQKDSKLSPLEKYAQVLLLSNELSYVD
jgi:mono/diheme cytochrome c family protein